MNVSRFQGLEVLKIRQKEIDSDQASLKLKLIKVNGASTSDSQIVHRTEKLVQAVTITLQKALHAVGVVNKFYSLSLSMATSLSLSIKRTSRKDEDKIATQKLTTTRILTATSFFLSKLSYLFTFCL